MIDLSTTYLGLPLKNPIVPSSSPFSRDLGAAKSLEDAGAAALVMHSLFEEELRQQEAQLERFVYMQSIGHSEAQSFHTIPADYHDHLDVYLEQLQALKRELSIPVIASLNGISREGWLENARLLQEAGADALELNVYYVPSDPLEDAAAVELRYVDLLRNLRREVNLPIAMKLSSQFSAPGHLVKRLEAAGAAGVSLFNRFYQPDIDLETLQMSQQLELSSSAESLLRIRWVGLLREHVKFTLAVTGGMHTEEDVLKALLAGADVTHLCSELLLNGSRRIAEILSAMQAWMEEKEYVSVAQLKGSLSRQCAIEPGVYEHANYMELLDSYTASSGVLR